MNFDELKSAWKCQGKSDKDKLEPAQLHDLLKTERRHMERALLISDIFVAAVLISCLVIIVKPSLHQDIVWPLYLGGGLILAAAGFHPWKNHLRRRSEREHYGESLKDELLKKYDKLDHQIRFSRWSSIWDYYLPIIAGLCLFYYQSYLNDRTGLKELHGLILFNLVLLGLLGYFAGGLGVKGARTERENVIRELAELDHKATIKEVPVFHRIARAMLVAVSAMIAGYLAFSVARPTERTGQPFIPAPAFDQLGSFDVQEKAQLDAYLESVRKAGDYPALMVSIVGNGKVLYQNALGHADSEALTKATPDTLWHVASVTKAFTATLAAVLHQEGTIDLDKPAIDYLPDSFQLTTDAATGATITLRQLASHTSGLPRSNRSDVQKTKGRYDLDPEMLYDQLVDVELQFPPGTDEDYSNLGFGLLGHVLSIAAGASFDDLLKEKILKPLSMNTSGINVAEEHSDLMATGYGRTAPRERSAHSFANRMEGSGGLITSVSELSSYLLAQIPGDENETVFPRSVLTNLHTEVMLNDGTPSGTALGWSMEELPSIGRVIEKNGGRINTSAWIGFSPEGRVGVAVIVNCGDAEKEAIGRWLLERVAPHSDITKLNKTSVSAKLAPFSAVRWEGDSDQPLIEVNGDWVRLTALEGIRMESLMESARNLHDERARMRFEEDLVELLASLGHSPDWTVSLSVENEDRSSPRTIEATMTEENREAVRDRRLDKEE